MFQTELLEPRMLLAAGAVDSSFGYGGYAGSGYARTADLQPTDIAVAPDGKTIVLGNARPGAVLLMRLTVNGSNDSFFGPDRKGWVITAFGTSGRAEGVAVQSDGKIVVAGSSDGRALVARYNVDGSLDQGFDGDGWVSFEYAVGGHVSAASSLAMTDSGKIVVGGFEVVGPSGSPSSIGFARLNPDGSFDSSFGIGGRRLLDFGGSESLTAMGLDYYGTIGEPRVIVAGTYIDPSSHDSWALVSRLNGDGGLDTSFAGDGRILFRYGDRDRTEVAALLVQDGGKVVLAGTGFDAFGPSTRSNIPFLERLTAAGTLDPTFGQLFNLSSNDKVIDMIRSYEGGMIVSGWTERTDLFSGNRVREVVFRAFDADGHLDPRFGTDGMWRLQEGLHLATGPLPGGFDLAAGPGRRFVATRTGMGACRFLDIGANLVGLASLDPVAKEQGQDPASVFVFRTERLPYTTRVFFTVGGTAVSPVDEGLPPLPRDYFGVDPPPDGQLVRLNTGYADILPGQTYAVVTITPVDDTFREAGETALFTLQSSRSYDIGTPPSVELFIQDNDVVLDAAVMSRLVFYNNSVFDGHDPAANGADDAAIATDKVALLPGQTPTFANYTSFTKGINGIMLDIAALPAGTGLGPADFGVKVGNSGTPQDWADGPAPTVTVRRATRPRQHDRVTLTWPDGAIRNQWVQVTVKSTLNTGLPTSDVFSFGNIIGETGFGAPVGTVGPADAVQVRQRLSERNQPVTSPFDFDRNGVVNALDLVYTRSNQQRELIPPLPPVLPPLEITALSPLQRSGVTPRRSDYAGAGRLLLDGAVGD